MSFHFAVRHLFPSSVGYAVSAQRWRRPRTCSRTDGGAARCTVNVHSKYFELQRRARSFRSERIQLRICSEAVSLNALSAFVGLVKSRAFCASQAPASCVHSCMPQLRLRALCARVAAATFKSKRGAVLVRTIPRSS